MSEPAAAELMANAKSISSSVAVSAINKQFDCKILIEKKNHGVIVCICNEK